MSGRARFHLRQRNLFLAKPDRRLPRASQLTKLLEYAGDRLLHLPVRRLLDVAFLRAHKADRQLPQRAASFHLLLERCASALSQQVQLKLAHRALESQHQAIIELTRIIDPVIVNQQRFGQRAQIDQVMPVSIVASESRSFQGKHRPCLPLTHCRQEACHYCGACGKGCDTASFFNTADHLLPFAMETGNLEIVENAVVGRVFVNDEGLASGVQYFDRYTGKEHVVPAKRVVMAASCVDSTRILLNSKSRQYPNGIGNGSGVIGKYLCDQVRFHMPAFAPQLMGRPASNDDGISGGHIYLPRFDQPGGKRDYLRGYGVQFWGGGCQNNASFAKKLPGFGLDFKETVKQRYPALVQLHPYGEVLPRASNRISVEGTPKDRYGVPLFRIEYDIGDNERKMIEAMYDTAEEILHEMKAEVLPYKRGEIDKFGSAIHEHGTCRMGKDAKRSALNGYCQMHEVKNMFVVDGSAFPTATEKNPTLTILAMAWRASDYLADEMKKGNV